MNPSDTIQMIGRAGRNGRPGLGIILVEPRRGGTGKNHVNDFVDGDPMSDDDQMDASAINKLCLRVSYSVDTL